MPGCGWPSVHAGSARLGLFQYGARPERAEGSDVVLSFLCLAVIVDAHTGLPYDLEDPPGMAVTTVTRELGLAPCLCGAPQGRTDNGGSGATGLSPDPISSTSQVDGLGHACPCALFT